MEPLNTLELLDELLFVDHKSNALREGAERFT
jgi:hypothetical protein